MVGVVDCCYDEEYCEDEVVFVCVGGVGFDGVGWCGGGGGGVYWLFLGNVVVVFFVRCCVEMGWIRFGCRWFLLLCRIWWYVGFVCVGCSLIFCGC